MLEHFLTSIRVKLGFNGDFGPGAFEAYAHPEGPPRTTALLLYPVCRPFHGGGYRVEARPAPGPPARFGHLPVEGGGGERTRQDGRGARHPGPHSLLGALVTACTE